MLLQRYEVETLQNRQEHPKREIAALGPVQVDVRRLLKRLRARSKRLRRSRRATARRLLKRLQSLPEGLRHPLGAGNTETRLVELIGATKAQLAAAIDNVETQLEEMAGHVEHALAERRRRPTPARLANPAAVVLRTGLLEVFAAYAPNVSERERDRRVAEVLLRLRVRFPSAKKNRRRFRGRSRK